METTKAGGGIATVVIERGPGETGMRTAREEEEVGGTETVTVEGGGVAKEGGEMSTSRTGVEAIGTGGEVAIRKEGRDTATRDLAAMEIVMGAGEEAVMVGETLVRTIRCMLGVVV